MKRFIIGSGWLMVVTFVAVAVTGTSNEFCLDSGCDFSKTACSKRANGCHQENRTLDGGAGVDGDVGTNDGVITGGDGGNSAHGQGGDGGMGVTGGIDVNHGTVGGGSGGGTDDGTPGSDGVPYGGSVGVNDGTVVKARVNVPQLAAKVYSGARQTADVPDDPRWGVVFNDGGTSVGTYRVGLVLADPDRYCWVDAQDEFAFPSFTISKAVIDVSGVAWAYSGPFNYTAEAIPDLTWVIKPAVPIGGGNTDSLGGDTINYSGVYDGEPHGISVVLRDPRPAGACVRYARSKNGPYSDENPQFSNVCRETVWFVVTADDWEIASWAPSPAGGGHAVVKGRGNYAGTLEVDIGNEMTVVFDAVYGAEGAILRTHTTQIPGEPYMLPPTPYYHGYEFLGWFTERVGGTELSRSTIAHLSDASTYYAHWQVSRFHVSFDCGAGVCDGCEDGLDVAFGSNYARLPRPSRQGYLFDGWYASPDFDKTSKVQDGDAVANEDIVLHAKWERRRLWYTDSLFHVEKSTTWDGYVIGDDESAVGVVQLKVGKPNKKTGLSKVSATVQIVGEKKLKLKGTTFDGQLEMVAKDGRKLSLRLSESGMSGDFDGMSVDGARNVFKAGDAASKLIADQTLRHWQGKYVTVFKGNSGYGGLALEVKSKGNVRVAGALADGTKVNGKAQLLVGERECAVPFCWTKNSAKMSFLVWFCEDGSLEISNLNDPGMPAAIANQKTGAYLPSGSALRVSSADISAMLGSNVLVEYLPDGVSVVQNGGKWVLAKAGKLSMKRGEIQVKGDNPSGLKLSYKLNDSTFKGAFTAYSLVDGKLKKQKFEILGIVIGGKGYGTAVAKKIGCVPVTIGNE